MPFVPQHSHVDNSAEMRQDFGGVSKFPQRLASSILCVFHCSMHFQPIIFEEDQEDEMEVGGLQPGNSGKLDVPKPSERLSTASSGASCVSSIAAGRKASGPPPGGSAALPPGILPPAQVACWWVGTACLLYDQEAALLVWAFWLPGHPADPGSLCAGRKAAGFVDDKVCWP
jgi:hypothetical protein